MKYKLFILKYSILKNDYIVEECIVETKDIYHTIGEIYCKTIEDIKRIDYVKIKKISGWHKEKMEGYLKNESK